MSDLYSNLENIIFSKNEQPVIVNEQSKFVVVTYWWGRGNQNANLARPCGAFYEFFISGIMSKANDVAYYSYSKTNDANKLAYNAVLENLHLCNYTAVIDKYSTKYINELMEYLGLNPHCNKNLNKSRESAIDETINEFKTNNKIIQPDLDFKGIMYVKSLFLFVAIEFVKKNLQNYAELIPLLDEKNKLNVLFSNDKSIFKANLNSIAILIAEHSEKAFDEFKTSHTEIQSQTELKKMFDNEIEQTMVNYKNIEEILLSQIQQYNIDKLNNTSSKIKNIIKIVNPDADMTPLQALAMLYVQKSVLNKEYSKNQLEIKNKLDNVKKSYNELNKKMKQQMATPNEGFVYPFNETNSGELFETLKSIYDDETIKNKSLNQIFVSKLRYKPSITYEAMIDLWKETCVKQQCNHLAIEYPEFAKPGGYQLAINAKPMFIQKALQLCSPRSVLYIDGDMYVRRYPAIFDINNVDYMARGWNVDPRASDKFLYSIFYDPYTFETSGGTMYFSQTPEASKLLNLWITETKKPIHKGKADDRIISLIFNTKKLLCDMKIIQLPIEYLWLTLDYDYFHIETGYYESIEEIHDTIFIEHPECLTSEETASGSGASSDRNPVIYNKFISNILEPISEEMYEYITFENEEMIASMKEYIKYMKNAYYFNDADNPIFYEKKLVNPQSEDIYDNEQPLYIFDYNKKFNKRNNTHEANMKNATSYDISKYSPSQLGVIEFDDLPADEMISAVLKCIIEKKPCLFVTSKTNRDILKQFYNKYDNVYSKLEFVYYPLKTNDVTYNSFYKVGIDTSQFIYVNTTENSVLYKYLSMFETFDDLSEYIINGAYYLISMTRLGYIYVKPTKGGSLDGEDNDDMFDKEYREYEEGLYDQSQAVSVGGKRRLSKSNKVKKNRRKTRRYKYY